MKARNINLIRLSAVALTILLVISYPYLPEKRHRIVPSNKWEVELFQSYTEDQQIVASWRDKASLWLLCEQLHFAHQKHCGFNTHYSYKRWQGVDLSQYERVRIRANYKGPPVRVHVFMRNFNPEYSTRQDYNSAKYLFVNLNSDEFSREVEIDLDEFVVADWWVVQRDLNRKLLPPEFTNITTLGFEFRDYEKEVPYLEFKIDSIVFTGPLVSADIWYLGIIIIWLVIISTVMVVQFVRLRKRQQSYSSLISDLIADRRDLELRSKKYEEMSLMDSLTGILNRAGIEKRLQSLKNYRHGNAFLLAILDIDHFKRINDQRGHDAGDRVLREISEIINENIREHDIFGRWGGEEFVFLTPMEENAHALMVVEKIRSLVARHVFEKQAPLKVTVSIGVSIMQPEEDFGSAFKRADNALYEAKSQGRNCCILADI